MSKKEDKISIPKTLCNCHISGLKCRFLVKNDYYSWLCSILHVYPSENMFGNCKKVHYPMWNRVECPFLGIKLTKGQNIPMDVFLQEDK